MSRASVGILGSRGYVGSELRTLVLGHEGFDLALSVSMRDGLSAEDAAREELDVYFLALPNGASTPYVDAIERARPDAVVVDLSADHRFDDRWTYGQPERFRDRLRGARRVANPGCYATAAELAVAPFVALLAGPPSLFGVSGYSGAGATPSPKNDPNVLRDNLLPYALTGHVHEREIAHALEHPVFFMPHVAPFFRGITVTASLSLREPTTLEDVEARLARAYGDEPMVHLTKEAPLVRDVAGRHHVAIGGASVSVDGRHVVLVATIDNLLGGAATQAVRNANLAIGEDELRGIPRETTDIPHDPADGGGR